MDHEREKYRKECSECGGGGQQAGPNQPIGNTLCISPLSLALLLFESRRGENGPFSLSLSLLSFSLSLSYSFSNGRVPDEEGRRGRDLHTPRPCRMIQLPYSEKKKSAKAFLLLSLPGPS